jgi:hypothetical protein
MSTILSAPIEVEWEKTMVEVGNKKREEPVVLSPNHFSWI